MPASLSFCEIQASEIVSFTVCCLYSDQHSKLEQGCELTYSSPGVWTVDQWPSQTNHRPTAEVTHSILVFQCGAFLTNAVQLYECSLIWSVIMYCIAFFLSARSTRIGEPRGPKSGGGAHSQRPNSVYAYDDTKIWEYYFAVRCCYLFYLSQAGGELILLESLWDR